MMIIKITEDEFRRIILYLGYLLAVAREEDKEGIYKLARDLALEHKEQHESLPIRDAKISPEP